MTALPPPSEVKLGLVIDLDTCVGCHACAVGGEPSSAADQRRHEADCRGRS